MILVGSRGALEMGLSASIASTWCGNSACAVGYATRDIPTDICVPSGRYARRTRRVAGQRSAYLLVAIDQSDNAGATKPDIPINIVIAYLKFVAPALSVWST